MQTCVLKTLKYGICEDFVKFCEVPKKILNLCRNRGILWRKWNIWKE